MNIIHVGARYLNWSCVFILARLRGVQDGLFTGQIDAVDTSAATYRVTFDRSGLGTHTVPDYEVLVRVRFMNSIISVFTSAHLTHFMLIHTPLTIVFIFYSRTV